MSEFNSQVTQFDPQTINLRSKGLNVCAGKIYKGCVKNATTKLSIGSIPSTYESIIYKQENTRAFGTSQKRFKSRQKAEMCQFSEFFEVEQPDRLAERFPSTGNVIGYGPLISKSKREGVRQISTPGPGQYYRDRAQHKLDKSSKRKCLTRNTKKRGKGDKSQEAVQSCPGPGSYLSDKGESWKRSSKGWRSSFETKVKRDNYISKVIGPGPALYETQLIRKPYPKKRGISAATSNKENIVDMLASEKPKQSPGPGSYEQTVSDFKPLYEKIKISSNFINPYFPKKQSQVMPGPTSYEVQRIYDRVRPKLIESPFFMSEAKRETFASKDCQGINFTAVQPANRKNFHFNITDEWLC